MSGINQVRYNKNNLGECVTKVSNFIKKKGVEYKVAKKKQEMWSNLFVAGGIVAVLYALTSDSEDDNND